jgi:hypothetical protein
VHLLPRVETNEHKNYASIPYICIDELLCPIADAWINL